MAINMICLRGGKYRTHFRMFLYHEDEEVRINAAKQMRLTNAIKSKAVDDLYVHSIGRYK